MLESRAGELLGRGVTTDALARLQHHTAKPSLGHIGGGDQAVVPGSCHDDVERLAHGHEATALRMSDPGAPRRRGLRPQCHRASPVHRPSFVIAARRNPHCTACSYVGLMVALIVPNATSVSMPAVTRSGVSPSFTGQMPMRARSS